MMLILFIIHVKINIFFGQGDANIIDLVLQVWNKKNVEQGILERKQKKIWLFGINLVYDSPASFLFLQLTGVLGVSKGTIKNYISYTLYYSYK